jgi:DNA adenine methylase
MNPFLKWPGAKRWLSSYLTPSIDALPGRYFEPFLGSGAVFFSTSPRQSVISDLNRELVETYNSLKATPGSVMDHLQGFASQHSQEFYYRIRDLDPDSAPERAARLIYLNRTCFNGVYRVNRQGKFNVPIGTRANIIRADDDFSSVAERLANAEIICADFEECISRAGPGDIVFADPPYTVTHNNNGFIKYNEVIFSWADQQRLAQAVKAASQRGANVILTNAAHPSVEALYLHPDLKTYKVVRKSAISGKAEGRKEYEEIVVSNIPLDAALAPILLR